MTWVKSADKIKSVYLISFVLETPFKLDKLLVTANLSSSQCKNEIVNCN